MRKGCNHIRINEKFFEVLYLFEKFSLFHFLLIFRLNLSLQVAIRLLLILHVFLLDPLCQPLSKNYFKRPVRFLKMIVNRSCFFLGRRDVLDRGVHCCHPQAGFKLDSKHFLGRSFCSGKTSGSKRQMQYCGIKVTKQFFYFKFKTDQPKIKRIPDA